LVLFTSYLFFLKLAFMLIALLILISNVDDAFVDLYYLIHKFRRRIFVYRKHRRFRAQDLLLKDEQPFALMIPAWREARVIGAMLENTLSSYNYTNYHIFVGCYPNDPETCQAVTRLLPGHKKLHCLVLERPGPTSKADCLNQLYRKITTFEQRSGLQFAGYILHDAEDIVHPLELKLYNHLIPRKDMVQIPVIPLERPWRDLTGGHYQDEFAENHIKELVVRESLTGHVPSAGVGTALSRRALATLSHQHRAAPFDPSNLTEDYDLALRLKQQDLRLIFARFRAGPHDIIATREFFPDNVPAVIRQKSRWLTGIALQGWRRQKWRGSPAMKYALFRDRKGILTAHLSMAAYFIVLNILLVWLIEGLFPDGWRYPPLVRRGEPLEYLLWANLVFLVNRALHRVFFTGRIYGGLSGLLSLPRQLWGNMLNFFAALRAIYLYSRHILFDIPLVWDKTDHSFPDQRQLSPYRKRLGELLIDHRLITLDQLDAALRQQTGRAIKLGQILVEQGDISDRDLTDFLSLQGIGHEPQD